MVRNIQDKIREFMQNSRRGSASLDRGGTNSGLITGIPKIVNKPAHNYTENARNVSASDCKFNNTNVKMPPLSQKGGIL